MRFRNGYIFLEDKGFVHGGSIAEEKTADLVICDDDWNIQKICLRGRMIK